MEGRTLGPTTTGLRAVNERQHILVLLSVRICPPAFQKQRGHGRMPPREFRLEPSKEIFDIGLDSGSNDGI